MPLEIDQDVALAFETTHEVMWICLKQGIVVSFKIVATTLHLSFLELNSIIASYL